MFTGTGTPNRSRQQRTLLDLWLDSVQAPLVLEISAVRAVPTVRNFIWRMQQRDSRLIRINLREANIHYPDDIELALEAKEKPYARATRREVRVSEVHPQGFSAGLAMDEYWGAASPTSAHAPNQNALWTRLMSP